MAITREEVEKMMNERFVGLKMVLDEREASIGKLMAGASAKLDEIDKLQAQTVVTVGEHEQRISNMLAGCNDEFAVVRAKYESTKTDSDGVLEELRKAKEAQGTVQGILQQASDKFAELESSVNASLLSTDEWVVGVKGAVVEEQGRVMQEVQQLKANVERFASGLKAEIMAEVGTGGAQFGSRPERAVGGLQLDKKQVAVWKLADNVSKPDFRHWLDAVSNQLEVVYKFRYPEIVLDKIRRRETLITAVSLRECVSLASDEVYDAFVEVHGREVIDAQGLQGPVPLDSSTEWAFEEKGRFLFSYLINILNTELYEKSIGVEHRNGFELYRLICDAVDAVPHNAQFFLGADISNLVHKYVDKVKDLKTLYAFRLLLKQRAAHFKKTIGKEVADDKLKEVLWNTMDGASKQLAQQAGVDDGEYKALCAHIDMRFKLTYGTFDQKAGSKDDPMGLHALLEGEERGHPEEQEEQWREESGDLDAMGKGKGKGKGGAWLANGGKCNACGGEGHFARNCASAQGPDGKATGTDVCYGCNGKGHQKKDCTTANPHLKGDGKGYDGGKGKGKFGKGKGVGKGKGYWGKRQRLWKRQRQDGVV